MEKLKLSPSCDSCKNLFSCGSMKDLCVGSDSRVWSGRDRGQWKQEGQDHLYICVSRLAP